MTITAALLFFARHAVAVAIGMLGAALLSPAALSQIPRRLFAAAKLRAIGLGAAIQPQSKTSQYRKQ